MMIIIIHRTVIQETEWKILEAERSGDMNQADKLLGDLERDHPGLLATRLHCEVSEYDDIEEELTEEEYFEKMYLDLNLMLNLCGFAPIDPRVPFDWMILFCICKGEQWLVDSRIEEFLNEVFAGLPMQDPDNKSNKDSKKE